MAKSFAYHKIIVESFIPASTSGKHGDVHVRPIQGQFYPQHLFVECSRRLKNDFPVGTKLRIQVKLSDLKGGGEFLYSYHGWPFEVIPAKLD